MLAADQSTEFVLQGLVVRDGAHDVLERGGPAADFGRVGGVDRGGDCGRMVRRMMRREGSV